MWHKRVRCRLALLLILTIACESDQVLAFPWNRDMAEQPAVQPYTQPMPLPPAGTLPLDGEWPVSRFDQALLPTNPAAGDAAATERGKKLYGIYCAPCHGDAGRGGGPVSARFAPPPDLTLPAFRRRADGYLYEVIRAGGVIMPAFAESLAPAERWEVVNYLRKLQEVGTER